MSSSADLCQAIRDGRLDASLERLYGETQVEKQRTRYIEAVEEFERLYGDAEQPLYLFSAPGRTEIGGNHTDHNHGRVLAGSVDMDVIAVVRAGSATVRVKSQGYAMDTVLLSDLAPIASEREHSASLIRGTAARFAALGYGIGGFDAYTTSNVLKGSGLSSSAAFEVLIGVIFNHLYNDGRIDPVEIAQIAQYAENVYFGKPCGLMDQMASSVGNIITIDFADTDHPVIERVDVDFAATGYALCIVDVHGDHADLTDEYAAIPAEMKAVAASLGASVLREITMTDLLSSIAGLRQQHGDRAVLRAIHFLRENERVSEQVAALRAGDFDTFKRLVIDSGHSSFEYLQNIYASKDTRQQAMSIALAVAQGMLDGCGAWRVHGGGFGGTIQCFVPVERLEDFCLQMEHVLGEGSCHVTRIRPCGGVRLTLE